MDGGEPIASGLPLIVWRADLLRVPHPLPEQLIADREHYRADEQADDAAGDHAAQGTDQHHWHRYIDTTPQQQWLEYVIDQAGNEDIDGEHNSRRGGTLSDENVDDHRESNQSGR